LLNNFCKPKGFNSHCVYSVKFLSHINGTQAKTSAFCFVNGECEWEFFIVSEWGATEWRNVEREWMFESGVNGTTGIDVGVVQKIQFKHKHDFSVPKKKEKRTGKMFLCDEWFWMR